MDQQSNPPAGWYPAGNGNQRYWDGEQWTERIAPAQTPIPPQTGGISDANWILAAHISPLVLSLTALFGFLGPLVVWAVKKNDSELVAYHAKEALNFHLTLLLALLVSAVLSLVLIGLALLAITVLLYFVVPIFAAVAANRGERFRYPMTIRFVS